MTQSTSTTGLVPFIYANTPSTSTAAVSITNSINPRKRKHQSKITCFIPKKLTPDMEKNIDQCLYDSHL